MGVRPGEVQHLDDELVLQLLQRSNSGVYKVPYSAMEGGGVEYIRSVWEDYPVKGKGISGLLGRK